MADCCRSFGETACWWPGGRCNLTEAPLAEDSPWIVYDNEVNRNPVGPGGSGLYAEKIVGSVVIGGRVADGNPGTNAVFRQPDLAFEEVVSGGNGWPAGARDRNAVNVFQQKPPGGNSVAAIEFTSSVVQPRVQARIIDLDNRGGGAGETVRVNGSTGANQPFGPTNMGEADQVIPFMAKFGNPASQVTYVGGGGTGTGYKGHPTLNENSAVLIWEDRPWGDGANGADPMVIAWVLAQAGSGGNSMYDFGGRIFQEPCSTVPRHARLLECCGNDQQWIDTVTGDALSPEDAATITFCGPAETALP